MSTFSGSYLSRFIASLFVITCWNTAFGADEDEYHLTGIIGSDSGKAFAVIEQADGQQRLLSEGDAVGDGYIGDISNTAKTVVLIFPERKLLMRLTGSGQAEEYQEEYQEEYSIEDYQGHAGQASLGPATLDKILLLAKNTGEMKEQERAVRLNQLLGLSEQAKIAAFEEEGVESTAELLQRLATRLPEMVKQGGHLGTIAVADKEGRRRIYLMASEPLESNRPPSPGVQ